MELTANTVLESQLARGLGLDRHEEIMHGIPTSPEFQRLFNGYYRIRRNAEWRSVYYALFAKARRGLSRSVFENRVNERQ